MSRPLGLLRRIRYDLWVCRLGALVVGLTSGGFYAVRHWRDSYLEVGALGPSVDDVATAIVVAVTCWLLISLAIGLLGSIGVLIVPGSLRDNPWSRARPERD